MELQNNGAVPERVDFSKIKTSIPIPNRALYPSPERVVPTAPSAAPTTLSAVRCLSMCRGILLLSCRSPFTSILTLPPRLRNSTKGDPDHFFGASPLIELD